METCKICNRPLGANIDELHLIPKTFKGKDTITLHKICHRFLHATISEREMVNYYHTIDRILERDEIQKFIKWVSKKPIDYYSGTDESKERRKKR